MPRLLLIDDDAFLLRHLGGKFSTHGFEVSYAHDGAEGLALAGQLKPDVIACDFRMPVMDGIGFGGRLKAVPDTKDIPLVLLTSEDFSPAELQALHDLGVTAYVHKSVPFEELLAAVNAACGKAG
jgi:CheY-like chemotaxis protein